MPAIHAVRTAAFAAVLTAGAVQYAGPAHAQTRTTPAPAPSMPTFDASRGVLSYAPLLEQITPAVVNVSVSQRAAGDNPLMRDPFFRRFFGLPDQSPRREAMSAGSGVIIDAAQGLVLTNNHVVQNAELIRVRLTDGRELEARRLGTDPATDIALLKLEGAPRNLVQLTLGNSDEVKVGDVALAIGNPFGLGQTVTSGIVSATGRRGLSPESYEDFVQTDAAINPGNSGGALVNTKGELIGINSAILAPAGGNIGIGFAVPVNMARVVAGQLQKYGEVRRGQIGVAVQTVTTEVARNLGIGAQQGALIERVETGSTAAQAGLRRGDVIVEVDGRPIDDASDVRLRVGLLEPGATLAVTYLRNGARQTASVRVGEAARTEAPRRSPVPVPQ